MICLPQRGLKKKPNSWLSSSPSAVMRGRRFDEQQWPASRKKRWSAWLAGLYMALPKAVRVETNSFFLMLVLGPWATLDLLSLFYLLVLEILAYMLQVAAYKICVYNSFCFTLW